MTERGLKTLEEHKEYIEQMCRISFFFTDFLKSGMPEKTAGEILRDHTPLFYHTLNYSDSETKWDNPDCLRIMKKADEIESNFEETMFAEIKDFAMARAEEFYPVSVGIQVPPDYNAGSLKYDPPDEKRPPDYCNFHIANAVAPKSIFDDPEYLPECFIELMDRSEKEYGYDTLATCTWLNDNSRWLKLFPQEWHDNLVTISVVPSWNFGFWGQMVTARGTFNYRSGEYLRENGRLKYSLKGSHCSFKGMRKHLQEFK